MIKKHIRKINLLLGALLVAFLILHQAVLMQIGRAMESGATRQSGSSQNTATQALVGDITQDSIVLTISQGAPAVYGEELGVSFSKVQPSIDVMRQFDPGYGNQKITLTGEELTRYIDIGLRISCEYCCGALSIIFKDGSAACGCAHSQAMRGLAAYLLKNHGSAYSNDQILQELARWKGMFFPKQMIAKMANALSTGTYTPDTAALTLGYTLPQYGLAGKNAPLPSEINNLPSMVGGC